MRLFLPIRPLCARARARARVCTARTAIIKMGMDGGFVRRPSTSTAAAAADGGASGKYRIAVYIASISGTGVIVEEEIEQVCRRCGLYDEGGG